MSSNCTGKFAVLFVDWGTAHIYLYDFPRHRRMNPLPGAFRHPIQGLAERFSGEIQPTKAQCSYISSLAQPIVFVLESKNDLPVWDSAL